MGAVQPLMNRQIRRLLKQTIYDYDPGFFDIFLLKYGPASEYVEAGTAGSTLTLRATARTVTFTFASRRAHDVTSTTCNLPRPATTPSTHSLAHSAPDVNISQAIASFTGHEAQHTTLRLSNDEAVSVTEIYHKLWIPAPTHNPKSPLDARRAISNQKHSHFTTLTFTTDLDNVFSPHILTFCIRLYFHSCWPVTHRDEPTRHIS